FVQLASNGDAFLDVLEADATLVFADDRACERVPRCQALAGLDGIAIAYGNGGAVRHFVAFALATVVVEDDDFAGTRDGNTLASWVGHITQADLKADRTGRLGFHRAGHGCTRRRTPDV